MHSYGKDCDSLALHTHFFLMSFSLESSKRKKKKSLNKVKSYCLSQLSFFFEFPFLIGSQDEIEDQKEVIGFLT